MFLTGKKTYIVIVMGLVAVWGGFLQGAMDLADAVNQTVVLLGLGGLRIGMPKK